MAVIVLVDRRHDLTEPKALALRQAYAESNPVSIAADVVEWQRVRYGSDLTTAEFHAKADGHQIIEILTQMLWERRECGYPWKRVAGILVALTE